MEMENFIKKVKAFAEFMHPVVTLDTKGERWLLNKANGKIEPVLLTPTKEILDELKVKRFLFF